MRDPNNSHGGLQKKEPEELSGGHQESMCHHKESTIWSVYSRLQSQQDLPVP